MRVIVTALTNRDCVKRIPKREWICVLSLPLYPVGTVLNVLVEVVAEVVVEVLGEVVVEVLGDAVVCVGVLLLIFLVLDTIVLIVNVGSSRSSVASEIQTN